MVSAARSVFNVVSNFVLITRYGIIGAAAATAATDVFAVVLYWIVLARAGLAGTAQLAYLGKAFAALIPIVPLCRAMAGIHPVIQCAVALPVYGITILWFRLFTREEIETFRNCVLDKWRAVFNNSSLPGSK
jgi:O-antigen/teichoic acid export membrane protein